MTTNGWNDPEGCRMCREDEQDATAIQALAGSGARVYSDIVLPSGRRLTPDEANAWIDTAWNERLAGTGEG